MSSGGASLPSSSSLLLNVLWQDKVYHPSLENGPSQLMAGEVGRRRPHLEVRSGLRTFRVKHDRRKSSAKKIVKYFGRQRNPPTAMSGRWRTVHKPRPASRSGKNASTNLTNWVA